MKTVECKECDGQGYIEYTCSHCNGSGEGYREGTICRFCKGTGTKIEMCEICEGEGTVDKMLSINFDLPNEYYSEYLLNVSEIEPKIYCFSVIQSDSGLVDQQIVLSYDLLKKIMKVINNNEKELNQLMNIDKRIESARNKLIQKGIITIDGSGDPDVEDLFRIVKVISKDLNKEDVYK